jgi:hypothetical protein
VAAAILAAPSAALAGVDDPAQFQFKLPNGDAIPAFETLGAAADHGLTKNPDGSVLVSAWLTDDQLAVYRTHGYEPVKVLVDKFAIDSIRAERNATLKKLKAANDALRDARSGTVKPKGKSLADGDIHASRADYWEDTGGRWLSIEANADGAHFTGNGMATYVGPTVTGEWFDGTTRLGGGNIGVYVDGDPQQAPDFYQYHYTVFRVGSKGDGGPVPTSIRVASSNGTTDTLAVKEWVGPNPPKPTAPLTGFVTHYNDSQEAYKKVRDLAAEFPTISEAVKLPEKTAGYQRRAQTMLGYTNATGNGPTATVGYVRFDANNLPLAGSTPTTAQQASTVVLTSRKFGHLGGNSLTAQIVAPATGAADQPLSVSLTGNAIRINPATDASGAITSTAAQVVAALNANPAISNVVLAETFRTNAGAGVVQPGAVSALSDLLRAPASFPRGPQDQYMLRIGKTRDGAKVGVFFYCQEHGNEIATSGVCLETMERLVRNYGSDPQTTALVDNLEIFVIPQINGDGATHSLYDSNRRTNLSNHCAATDPATGDYIGANPAFASKETDPASRNSWGVDMNRNFQSGSVFDMVNGIRFQGATFTDCTNGNFSGPEEHSEAEVRNETWVQTTFRNIKFANNIHSNGGLFMWPPGAYTQARVPLPYPPYGTLNFFDQTGKSVLEGIKSHRGTSILPQRTGPVIDVLYSAAGNSADEAYYENGIIGFDFEIGTTNYYVNPTTGAVTTCGASQQPPFGDSTNDCLDNEGFHEAMEYASGNYGLLEAAKAYGADTTAPVVASTAPSFANTTQNVRFTSNEAASIYYTLDGSTPTTASTEWKPVKARALPLPISIADDTTIKWIATDFKGNVSSVGSKAIMIETDKPTATLNGFTEGQVFTQGRPIPVTYSCADEAGGSGLASCVGTTASGANLPTGTPGTFTYTVTATDNAGNQTVVSRSYTVLTATNQNGGVSGQVPATLALTLGPAAQFPPLVAGVGNTYTASTSANVVSSAGDALLSVSDPSSTHTGHLVNGAFFLPQPLQARARNAGTTSPAYNNVGSSASPLNLLSYSAPISNDAVTLEFSQRVNANDALRTGTYSKALTFTLSTTQP